MLCDLSPATCIMLVNTPSLGIAMVPSAGPAEEIDILRAEGCGACTSPMDYHTARM